MSASKTVNVNDLIDSRPVGRFQIEILILCILVTFVDGFDVQSIAFAAPDIISGWKITKGAFTPALLGGVIGTVVGTLGIGPFADVVGKKRIIILSTLLVGLCSLATGFAHSIETLAVIRFLTGLGIGGAYPNAISLASDYSPGRRQTLMVVLAVSGNSFGGVVGGMLASEIIPAFGWQGMFLVGGVLPLLLVPVLMWRLAESVPFLVATRKGSAAVIALLGRLAPEQRFAADTDFVLAEHARGGVPVKHLFTDGRYKLTLPVWGMWFMNLTGMFFLSAWLPTITKAAGLSLERSELAGSLLHAGGIMGCIGFGLVVRSVNSCTALSRFYLMGAVSIAVLGQVSAEPLLVLVAAFVAGFCVIGAQNSSNAVTARLYPNFIGSTGMSWAFGVGRMGSVAGPAIGGLLLSIELDTPTLFLVAAVPGVLASICAAIVSSQRAAREADLPVIGGALAEGPAE